jgi:hypothetical protein
LLPLGISSNAIENNGNKLLDQFVSLGNSSNSIKQWNKSRDQFVSLGISWNILQNIGSKWRDQFLSLGCKSRD